MIRLTERQILWLIAILAGLLATASLLTGSGRPIIGHISLANLLIAACSLTLATLCAWLASQPTEYIARIFPQPTTWPTGLIATNRFWPTLVIALAVVSSGVHLSRLYHANQVVDQDEIDYLRVATLIRHQFGIAGLWQDMLLGSGTEKPSYLEANRHPLYPSMHALSPTFATGKIISLLGWLAVLIVIGWWSARQSGWFVSAIVIAWLSHARSLLNDATLVACETWLTLFLLLAWITLSQQTVRSCLWAGVFAGLAWLTKASAFFLVIGYALSFILSRFQPSKSMSADRVSSLRNEHKYFVFVLAFAITALPLLARNTRIFGNPFYSFNTRYLFSDHFDHEQQDVSVKVAFAEYLRTHSARDIALRAGRGLFWQSFVLARSFGPIGFDSERVAVGGLLLLGVGLAIWQRGITTTPIMGLLFTCVIFVLFFAWYQPIASGDRFMSPLIPMLMLLGVDGWCRWLIAAQVGVVRARNEKMFVGITLAMMVMTHVATLFQH